MLEPLFDHWWGRYLVIAAGLGLITYPQWLPTVKKLTGRREKDSEPEIDKALPKKLQEKRDAIDDEAARIKVLEVIRKMQQKRDDDEVEG